MISVKKSDLVRGCILLAAIHLFPLNTAIASNPGLAVDAEITRGDLNENPMVSKDSQPEVAKAATGGAS